MNRVPSFLQLLHTLTSRVERATELQQTGQVTAPAAGPTPSADPPSNGSLGSRTDPGLDRPQDSASDPAPGDSGRDRWRFSISLALPHLLGGFEQRVLHLPQETLQASAGVATLGQLIGEGTGVAEIHQQGNLIRAEADQVFVVAMGDLHGASEGTKDVLGRSSCGS